MRTDALHKAISALCHLLSFPFIDRIDNLELLVLHHISLPVTDLEASKALYDAAMEAIGYRCVFTHQTAVGYGIEDGKDKLCLKLNPRGNAASEGFHLAFAAPSQQAVDDFHKAALKFGARDNGQPGFREHYGPNYYAGFVIDIDGHRLEAVHK